jgi:hypothetical protein
VGEPTDIPLGLTDEAEYGAGGLVVAWAESNTRDSIFRALHRKEVYGTSGTRPVVRFFGGYGENLPKNLCERHDSIKVGYNPANATMGGTLANSGQAPSFMVSALMDPGEPAIPGKGSGETIPARPGTRLQQIQIIKGWTENSRDEDGNLIYDDNGNTITVMREHVYKAVAGSLDNGASVNTKNCKEVGRGKGDKSLCTVWQDPDYNPEHKNAFYYARVLENPVCRWSTYQCNAAGITENFCDAAQADPDLWVEEGLEGYRKCCPYVYPGPDTLGTVEESDIRTEELDKTIQERAWTTPIWVDGDGAGL